MIRNAPLKWLGWLVVATGLAFVLIATVFPAGLDLVFLFSPGHTLGDVNAAGRDIVLALSAVFGATMMGWGITLVYVSDRFTRAARSFITVAVLAWYVADSAGSLLNQLGYNAILNSLFLILVLAALFVPKLPED